MTTRSLVYSIIILSLVAFVGACSSAKKPEASPAAPPPMPSKEEMLAKFHDYSTPGEGHKVLNAFVGNWNHTVTWWITPNEPPEISKGTSAIRWMFGGRFIEHKVSGKSMGKPFEGLGITGYDKAVNQYRSMWLDSMGTGMMVSSGSFNQQTKTLTEIGTASCPIYGTTRFRGVTTVHDPRHFTYEMFMSGPDGKESRVMQIEYVKRK